MLTSSLGMQERGQTVTICRAPPSLAHVLWDELRSAQCWRKAESQCCGKLSGNCEVALAFTTPGVARIFSSTALTKAKRWLKSR
jgi:hypothetical protein